jgi:heptosyltransferase-2
MSVEPRAPASVIIDPAYLGDVVFDGPLARALKRRGLAVRVGLVVRPPAEAVARRLVDVDRVHVFDKKRRDRGLAGLARLAEELAREGYDQALIPHPSLRSSLLAHASGIPWRIGSTPGWLARWPLDERRPSHPRDTFVGARLRLVDPSLAGRAEEEALAGVMARRELRPAGGRPRVGLVLGSEWATKRWPPARAAELVRGLAARGASVVLLGASWERPLFAELLALGPEFEASLEDRLGGSVDALIEGIEGCDVLVAGDTGPLHIARALGLPVVGLFGPTPAERHAFAALDRVLAVELPCRPCSAHGHQRCPLGHHRCMEELTGAAVEGPVAAALRRLDAREVSPGGRLA